MPSAAELRTILSGRGFRLLYATRLLAQSADGLLQAGLASYVLFSPERQADGGKVAAAFAVLLLPYSLVGPFAGVLLDRWRRQRVLVLANVVRGALVAVLAVLVWGGSTGGGFLVVALCVLGVNRFFLAGLSAALPHVVEPGRLVTANALAATSGTVAAALGAALGLVVRAVGGGSDVVAAGTVVVAGLGYLASATVATRLGRDELGPERGDGLPRVLEALRGVVAGMTAGVRHLTARPRPARALAAVGWYRFLFGLMTVLVVLLERGYFHAPSDADGGLRGVSLVFAATGLGVPVGAVLTPAAVRRIGPDRWVTVLLVGSGVGVVVLGLPFLEVPLALVGFVLGLTGQGIKLCADTAVQQHVEDRYRGRVFALYDMLYNVAFVAAAGLAAATLPVDGHSAAVLAGTAGGFLLGAAAYARASASDVTR